MHLPVTTAMQLQAVAVALINLEVNLPTLQQEVVVERLLQVVLAQQHVRKPELPSLVAMVAR